ncbi:MAG: PA0069 family radical SAM protein [Flavobacteriaceae bacterium]|nr:PA0069 family radical SAM protein [Bacteroidia bacterium]MBT8288325.1 PA0069 family radical SAM protein [Bacteroidia bacterium]NNF75099.1 PA0069 family radical SAM protein [Flavobacteriaceae bacterium]NNK73821.1 PA0069 family radical SAM protein [Flavobacteriaceae bacterium]
MNNHDGRGAQLALNNRFSKLSHEPRADFLNYCENEKESFRHKKTIYKEVYPKTIINKITSPDVGMQYSMNPYQGCEHGCVYCYARNSHEFWGYGPGLDFESRIMVKKNSSKLLEDKIRKKSWQACTIVMSGNTDCYQPAEKSFKITRSCLEVFLKYKHPVGIITKNALILRDIDLLRSLNKNGLIAVHISITTLSEKTRRLLEPRTASIKKRLNTVKKLSELGIPVNVMLAPIIPSINSHEILAMAKAASEAGAISVGHTMVRLNGSIGLLFYDWIKKRMPDRANKVMRQIEACHGGNLNDSRFGVRMRGEGKIAEQINDTIKIAKRKYFTGKKMPVLNTELHHLHKNDQLRLF